MWWWLAVGCVAPDAAKDPLVEPPGFEAPATVPDLSALGAPFGGDEADTGEAEDTGTTDASEDTGTTDASEDTEEPEDTDPPDASQDEDTGAADTSDTSDVDDTDTPQVQARFWVTGSNPVQRTLEERSTLKDRYMGSWLYEYQRTSTRRERFVAEDVTGLLVLLQPTGDRLCAWSASRLSWGTYTSDEFRYGAAGVGWDSSIQGDYTNPLIAEDLRILGDCADALAYFPKALEGPAYAPGPESLFRTACSRYAWSNDAGPQALEEDCGPGLIGVTFATVTGDFLSPSHASCDRIERTEVPAGSRVSLYDLSCHPEPNTRACAYVSEPITEETWFSASVWSCVGDDVTLEEALGALGQPAE